MTKSNLRHYEVLMHITLDLAEDTPENAQKVIQEKLNAGEHFSICHIFSIRPIPREELGFNDDKTPTCMVPNCGSEAYWLGPQGHRLCLAHYDMLKNPPTSKEAADVKDATIRRERSKEDLSFRTMYPIGKLSRYYGPGAEDLEVLREAFRRYIEQDAEEHGRVATPEQVEAAMDREIEKVIAGKTNSGFTQKLMFAVKANTEMQIHCEKHGEVQAFCSGDGNNLFCPECYNESLKKIETSSFKQHIDKIYKLPRDHFKVGGKHHGKYALLQVRVAKPLADYLEKCGHEALVYGCEVVSKKGDKNEN